MFRAFYVTLLSAMLAISNPSDKPNNSTNNSPNSESDKKRNIEQIVIGDFERVYDVKLDLFLYDHTVGQAVWKSYEYSDTTHNRRSRLPKRVRVIDGKAKINFIEIKKLNVEFKTYFDSDGMPVENITVLRDGKRKMSAYDSTIARREFSDWWNITFLEHTSFDYKRGVATNHSKKDSAQKEMVSIDTTVLDIQAAYFVLMEKIRKSSFKDTLMHINYGGENRWIPVHISDEEMKIDGKRSKYKKIDIKLTRIDDKGKEIPLLEGIYDLTLYNDSRLPVFVKAETHFINPNATMKR